MGGGAQLRLLLMWAGTLTTAQMTMPLRHLPALPGLLSHLPGTPRSLAGSCNFMSVHSPGGAYVPLCGCMLHILLWKGPLVDCLLGSKAAALTY